MSRVSKERLDPSRRLLDEVVGWLCGNGRFSGRVRIVEGARSLAHVMVIVPTAQSGRNLRLALAQAAESRGWGGIIPPKITMASALLVPKGKRIATEAEELAVMASVLTNCDLGKYAALLPKPPAERTADWALGMAGMLLGIAAILGERALMMADVKPELDAARWRDLADIERLFIGALRDHGVMPRSVARREAALAGCCETGIEEMVLPAAVDVQGAFIDYLEHSSQTVTVLLHAGEADVGKFDAWGRPIAMFAAELAPAMIETAPTAVVEADDVAKFFRAVRPEEALPALAVCDAEMYPELEGAFQNHFSENELVLRNPAQERLANSSLGRLLGAIVQLSMSGDYDTFSTLVRTGDVARWARGVLDVTAEEVARYVGALDAVQNRHLPRTLDEAIAGAKADAAEDVACAAGLARLAEAVKAELGEPLGFVRKIFASVTLDEKNPGDRELIAAAEVVRDLYADCTGELVPRRFRRKLFSQLLNAATYMLEPTAENVLSTIGWLEVAWCPEPEMMIAGFNEGCVPENIVGHPFVPDSLRAELDLSTNAMREFRDSFILSEAVACRERGAVSVRLHQIAGDKNVMKPSRLLFNGISDEELPALAMRLYAVTKGNDGAPPKELPSAWRLKLPMPPPGVVFRKRISPTALDRYRRCPFDFYLKEVFGEHADDRSQEMDALAFGNLCHDALEAFAKSEVRDSSDAEAIAAFLADEVRRQLKAFGEQLPAVVALQGEAAIERLRAFAPHQAAWRRAGWRVLCSEQRLACRLKGCPTELVGRIDRIDRNEATGELAIIDYKTWDDANKKDFDGLQLPAYRAMVEASKRFEPAAAHSAKALYCILSERPEDVGFDEEHVWHEGLQSAAEDEIVRLLTDLAKGVFYPPKEKLSEGYAPLMWESVEKGLDPEWIRDQLSRKEAQ